MFKGVFEDEENIKRKHITKLERKKRERQKRNIYYLALVMEEVMVNSIKQMKKKIKLE